MVDKVPIEKVRNKKIPSMTGRQFVSTLRKMGFEDERRSGQGHTYLRRRLDNASIHVHANGNNMGRLAISKLLRQRGISQGEFVGHL